MMSAPGSEGPDFERRCALCGKPQDASYRPFCSRRCADLDLGRWLRGDYVIEDGVPSEDVSSDTSDNN